MNETRAKVFKTSFETRAGDDGKIGTVTGLPVVYSSEEDLGWFREIIMPGALDKTDLRDVLFFVNHDTRKVALARSRNNNAKSTMRLAVDERGLNIEADLDIENNAEARSLYSAISRGDIDGMSFMFVVGSEEWEALDTDSPLRRITEIKQIIEVSAVTFPAYSDTTISARSEKEPDGLSAALDSARAAVDTAINGKAELELLREKTLILGGLK
jgi:HK97 family phage prohead protease